VTSVGTEVELNPNLWGLCVVKSLIDGPVITGHILLGVLWILNLDIVIPYLKFFDCPDPITYLFVGFAQNWAILENILSIDFRPIVYDLVRSVILLSLVHQDNKELSRRIGTLCVVFKLIVVVEQIEVVC